MIFVLIALGAALTLGLVASGAVFVRWLAEPIAVPIAPSRPFRLTPDLQWTGSPPPPPSVPPVAVPAPVAAPASVAAPSLAGPASDPEPTPVTPAPAARPPEPGRAGPPTLDRSLAVTLAVGGIAAVLVLTLWHQRH